MNFPYTIEGLRQHEFQNGKIHIRETLDENDFYTSYWIDYPSDGLTITGVMQIPKGEGPFPVIVMNHGFFSRSVFNSGDGTDRAAAFLNRYGYITLAPDYRSWGDSDIDASFFYSGLVTDVINLINAIPSIPEVDPERVGIWGHSMGGGVTMKVLTVLGVFDTPSATNASGYSGEFREMAARCRNAIPFFWVPRSYEKEITFRSGNYLGASVGLVPEGDVSGIAFPNPIVLDAMFGFWVGLAVYGGMSWLLGAAFRKIRMTRSVEWWMGYLILYLGLMVQVFIGLPAPAIPYKMVYEAFTWGACILMLRGCRSMMGWLAGLA